MSGQLPRYHPFIDGEFIRGHESAITYDPSNNQPIAEVSLTSPELLDRAIASARRAFDAGPWPHLPVDERASTLEAIAEALFAQRQHVAALECRDAGSVIRKARAVDVRGAVNTFRVVAQMIRRLEVEEPLPFDPSPGLSLNLLRREPVGVCAQIIPWNAPIQMAAWKIAYAIAAGNTVVLKPASHTPLTALELARITQELGLPAGVVNVVPGGGDTIGDRLVTDPRVDKIAFTGSTAVGSRIMEKGAATIKRMTMELGGKSAQIVLDDVDLTEVLDGVMYAAFFHSGQICEAGTRLFLPRTIYEPFVDALVRRTESLVVGPAGDPQTDLGPLISERQLQSVERYVKLGVQEGARLVTGGSRPAGLPGGWYFQPTIFTDVTSDMTIAREEIFGPVLCVIVYDELDDAIAMANDSPYGLGGAVWSANNTRALDVARQLRTGTVWINDYHLLHDRYPFGGFKQSGVGRELGLQGLEAYTELKHVHIDMVGHRRDKKWYDILTGAKHKGGTC